MDMLTSLPLPAALAILALVDGLSIGTLVIPLFLIIAPGRPRTGRVALYLATITAFYFAIGVLFTLGLVSVIDVARGLVDSTAGQTLLLVAGLALLIGGIAIGVADSRRRTESGGALPTSGRLVTWRGRLLDERATGGAVMGVAIAAGVIEIAGMLPYLLGMTMLAGAQIEQGGRIALLAGYCLVMIVPALALLGARVVAARAVEAPLRRFSGWLQRTGPENTAWLLGIVGFLLARMAATNLGVELPLVGA
ncbi:GAP family protein [Leucobacter luti]|uniref:Sap-like sulfolipid-1-addressing protein n=1 Tax=Leucobacter luti TaxID=340320 RepID=A0A4Q7TZT4_9MICO|nr:GAP family protein [Leucobacter luti]MBL3698625.1 hypothetical protein [Leucobacter luti]RZT66000.1 Sap-like sulfolipid-1-addressing protein [Leucobacter luti]